MWTHNYAVARSHLRCPKIARKIVEKFIARRPGQMWTIYRHKGLTGSAMFQNKGIFEETFVSIFCLVCHVSSAYSDMDELVWTWSYQLNTIILRKSILTIITCLVSKLKKRQWRYLTDKTGFLFSGTHGIAYVTELLKTAEHSYIILLTK